MATAWKWLGGVSTLIFAVGITIGLWHDYGKFPLYSRIMILVGLVGLLAVAIRRREELVRWAKSESKQPELALRVLEGEPWEEPDANNKRIKLVEVRNSGEVVARECYAQIEGIEQFPGACGWMNKGWEHPDLYPEEPLFLPVSFPLDGEYEVTVRVWCIGLKTPAKIRYRMSVAGDRFPVVSPC